MIPVHLIISAAHASKARQPATMVLEFPAPHVAVLKPSPAIARTRKFGIVAAVVAAFVAIVLAKMIATRPGHKFRLDSESLQHILIMVLPMFIFGVVGLVVIMRGISGTKCINFDRRQGMVWKEGRKLEPIWQGGIRLRDVASLELATTPLCGFAKGFALDMVMSRPQGEKIRLIAHGNREAIRADASELARFLNLPLKDMTA